MGLKLFAFTALTFLSLTTHAARVPKCGEGTGRPGMCWNIKLEEVPCAKVGYCGSPFDGELNEIIDFATFCFYGPDDTAESIELWVRTCQKGSANQRVSNE